MNIQTLQAELSQMKMKVDFNNYDFTVKEIVTLVQDHVINIAPTYQRKFRWDDERQSALIESILLGIPVPSLFMATNSDGTWEVIDGVQRISTLLNFILPEDDPIRRLIGHECPLKLKGLRKLKSFEGALFSDFIGSLKYDFLLKPLKVITLSDKSDKLVRFDLFERLNTGGVILSDQEIRSCIFRGEFNNFLKEMAENDNFKRLVKIPKNAEVDGSREELVLRFFAYLYNRDNFEHSVTDFLTEYMKSADEQFDYQNNRILFENVFEQLSSLQHGIVKSETRTITSFVLYEAVAVGAAEAIRQGKEQLNLNNFYNWVAEPDFNHLITGATNSRRRILLRINYCMNKFLE